MLLFFKGEFTQLWMTQKQDGGSNQCISIYTTIYAALVYNITKVPYLKQLKFQNCLSSFFFSQPSALTREVTQLKWPSTVRRLHKHR